MAEEVIVFIHDGIFALLNLHHPTDYTARSLSVSDVVEYEHDDGSRTAYFCDTVGFVRIPAFK